MDEIISINEANVKIGRSDGSVVDVPITAIQFPDPKVGDVVKVYRDGNDYIVVRHGQNSAKADAEDLPKEYQRINKHLFVWAFSFLLGGLGIDRFLRGQIGFGVCKLLFNWCTLGIWGLVDWIIATMKAYGSAFGDDEELVFDEKGNYIR